MQPIEISFVVEPNAQPCDFVLEFRVDDTVLWSSKGINQIHEVTVHTPDSHDKQCHELIFEMRGKTPAHTRIDDAGNIIEDHTVSIRGFKIDGAAVQHLLESYAVYHHDFNGSAAAINDEFFGVMGCNGTVTMSFSTPIFQWLLENA